MIPVTKVFGVRIRIYFGYWVGTDPEVVPVKNLRKEKKRSHDTDNF
jgi:hypothetical protein